MIKIDIPMPKSCYRCPFLIWNDPCCGFDCALDEMIDANTYAHLDEKRNPECPLIEEP